MIIFYYLCKAIKPLSFSCKGYMCYVEYIWIWTCVYSSSCIWLKIGSLLECILWFSFRTQTNRSWFVFTEFSNYWSSLIFILSSYFVIVLCSCLCVISTANLIPSLIFLSVMVLGIWFVLADSWSNPNLHQYVQLKLMVEQ